MASISSPVQRNASTLQDLRSLADQVGNQEKIRAQTSGVFDKTISLYSSSKAAGNFAFFSQRADKQQQAQTFIRSSLMNTLAPYPPGVRRELETAFDNILRAHQPARGTDLSGADLKSIVSAAEAAQIAAHDALDRQGLSLSSATAYRDSEVRSAGFLGNRPIKNLTIKTLTESIYRLHAKPIPISITAADGTTLEVMTADRGVKREDRVKTMFANINTALGRSDLDDRIACFTQFQTSDFEHLDPFSAGNRVDAAGLQGQDIFIAKFATKEMAATAVIGAFQGLSAHNDREGVVGRYKTTMKDQWDSLHVTVRPEGNFDLQGVVTIPLKRGDDTVGSVKMTLTTGPVNAATGDYDYTLTCSELRFTEAATLADKQHLLGAYSATLPHGRNPLAA